MTDQGKWVLLQDNDAHWYFVPLEHADKFDAWVAYTEDEDGLKDNPGIDFDNYRIGMHPSQYVFTGTWDTK